MAKPLARLPTIACVKQRNRLQRDYNQRGHHVTNNENHDGQQMSNSTQSTLSLVWYLHYTQPPASHNLLQVVGSAAQKTENRKKTFRPFGQ